MHFDLTTFNSEIFKSRLQDPYTIKPNKVKNKQEYSTLSGIYYYKKNIEQGFLQGFV